jgi:menaquinone-dependent protoporphyrinogen oxidase
MGPRRGAKVEMSHGRREMDITKVLVACASKMGSTAEIAGEVADRLRAAGLEVDHERVQDVRGVEAYRAVVLGSAVYMDRWRHEALTFLRRFDAELSDRAVWLFQSGPLDDTAERRDIELPRRVRAHADRIGIRAFTTFGGRIDAEHPDGFIAKRMVDAGLGKDFRDFGHIRAWADAIATELGACAPVA